MEKSSFTDEQLLNLVNNTIQKETEFDIYDFTGGSVICTNTHKGTQQSFKVSLYFGYKNKNPITRTLDIDSELVFIWMEAIVTKINSMKVSKTGMKFNDLNTLMNEPCIVVSNKVESISISRGSTVGSTTSSNTKHKQEFKLSIGDDIYECIAYQELDDDMVEVSYLGALGNETNMKISIDMFNKGLL